MGKPNIRYERDGAVRLMAEAEKYVMVRRHGFMPFVMERSQWDRLGETKEAGALVEIRNDRVIRARTTRECPDCGRPHAEIVMYPLKNTTSCPVRECVDAVESGHRPIHAARELEKAQRNCAEFARIAYGETRT